MNSLTSEEATSSFKRAQFVSIITTSAALLYHIGILFFFLFFKVYPMAFYNIFSVTLFAIICLVLPSRKSFVVVYMICLVEVIIHQVLGDFFLGTISGFHYFILVMGLIPSFVFDKKYKIAIPVSIISSLIFVILDAHNLPTRILIPYDAILIIKVVNIVCTVAMILVMVLSYTKLVNVIEERLDKQKNILETEINLAASIQKCFYRQSTPDFRGWDLDFYNRPMAGVSGDLFDIYKVDKNLKGLGIFDVSGHGISSGLVTMIVKNIIHQEFFRTEEKPLWETVTYINQRVIEEKGDIQNYLTGILVRVVNENTLEMVNAGHPLPILYKHASDSCELVERAQGSRGAIGMDGIDCFYDSVFVQLDPGDELILYTDGLTETKNPKDSSDLFGESRLIDAIKYAVNFPVEEQINQIMSRVDEFRGEETPTDDVTILVLRRKLFSAQ